MKAIIDGITVATLINNMQLEEDNVVPGEILEYLQYKINSIDHNRHKLLESYYLNKKEILKKHRMIEAIPNNKILSNYARYITEMNVGYFMSEPVLYNVNEDIDIEPIQDLFRKNTIIETDKENAKKLSKFGLCYELIYINENTEIKSKSIDYTNAFIERDGTLENKEVLGVYFAKLKEKYMFYIYTLEKMITIKTDFEKTSVIELKENMLGNIPLIELKNNEEQLGDFESVITLIDAYNKVVSNDIDNIEEFIDSILLIYGGELTVEQLKILKETKGLNLPTDAKAEYLTKRLDETGIGAVLERLRKDIHKFSFTPDMSDDNFAGNSSGVALEYKLLPFELLAKTKQAQYERAVKKRFKLYNIFLNVSYNMPLIPIEEVEVKFKRGLPKKDIETAEMIANLQGLVTNKTLISQLSFIQDANEEDELIQEERKQRNQEIMSRLLTGGGFNEENE